MVNAERLKRRQLNYMLRQREKSARHATTREDRKTNDVSVVSPHDLLTESAAAIVGTNRGLGYPNHLVSGHKKRARGIAVPIDWPEMLREARILELRLLIVLIVLIFLVIVIVVTIVVTLFLVVASIFIPARLRYRRPGPISSPCAGARGSPSTGGTLCSYGAGALVGCGFLTRLRFYRLIVYIIVAGLWRAFGHVDSGNGSNFMAF
jgi:hypothetical protein